MTCVSIAMEMSIFPSTLGMILIVLMEVNKVVFFGLFLVPECYDNCTGYGKCVCDEDDRCHCECDKGRFGPSCEYGNSLTTINIDK